MTGVVQEAGVPARPSISIRHIRQEPNASTMSVAQSFGICVPASIAARDGLIGHGGIVVFDDTVDMARQARFAMEFCAIESCGKCTPCRIGSTRGVEVLDRIGRGERFAANRALIEEFTSC